jgi:signal transduction histidine kinase/ligand-binding sensor domain-containing protein
MKAVSIILSIAIVIIFVCAVTAGVHDEEGRPFITNYSTDETGGDLQTWEIVQDNRGVMYFGNSPGVLEFDGSTWRMIENNNKTMVRSLGIDQNGRVYVGCINDFGFLSPDSLGNLKYESLLGYVNKDDRSFSYVWTTIVTDHGIYFQSREKLFRFQSEGDSWNVKVWKPTDQYGFAFWLDGTYFVQQIGIGMMKMVNDSLEMLPGGEQFANDRLQVMLPFKYSDKRHIDQYLLGTFENGLFIFDGKGFKPFKTDVDDRLYASSVYDGVILPDDTFGLATLSGGFFVIDHHGRLIQLLDQNSGLSSNAVECVFVDRQGGVWLCPENSISHVEILSPLSIFDRSSGILSAPADIERHNGLLYVANSDGVFYLDKKVSTFKPVSGITGVPQSFDLLSLGDELLAAVNSGLYRIEGKKAILLRKSFGLSFAPLALHQSRLDKNRVIVGMYDGLASFRIQDGKWIDEGRINGVNEYIISIVEPEPGLLWIGTYSRGAIRLYYTEDSLQEPKVERFGLKNRLPEGGVATYHSKEGVHFCTNWGLYTFNEQNNSFSEDTLFSDVSVGLLPLLFVGVHEDHKGNLWVNLGKETVLFRLQENGSYIQEKKAFLRFSDLPPQRILTEKNGTVWFGRKTDLVRYDPRIGKHYETDYKALIRKVTIGEGTMLFGGTKGLDFTEETEVPYSKNALKFDFAAPSYDNPRENLYQSVLEGFDDQESIWTKENKRVYTNLPPGNYCFVVRSKNIYENISQEASFDFRILPPWYRTWFAYVFYVLLLGFGIFITDRIQREKVIKRERDRAQLREAELRAQTAEAQTKALQSENERKKNVELLSEIGKEITASLSVKNIIDTVYEHINSLMNASVFGIGLYNEKEKRIDMPATKEEGRTLPLFYYNLRDQNRPAVWCFKNQKEIFTNNYSKEYHKFIKNRQNTAAGGSTESIMYLPLIYKEKKIGVITAQSSKKNAYTEYHLNILRNLATYTAIALDNAETYKKLNATLNDLKSTQQQMVTQEKLASLGALTAGIAHEIKNPLNFVNNFAELTVELVDELKEVIETQQEKIEKKVLENLQEILTDLEQNARKINEHGKRADSIIRSMLQHSRGKKGELQEIDINAMLEEDLNLSYHGMRAQDASFNVTIEKNFDQTCDRLRIIPQDISRVFLNIISNGFYEVHKKKIENNGEYSPTLTIKSINRDNKVEIRIRDNGNGIPKNVQEKLFNPFFTTKPTGMGTGLGLSISYDIIVQEHKGDISFETKEGEYTEFIISLPKNGA